MVLFVSTFQNIYDLFKNYSCEQCDTKGKSLKSPALWQHSELNTQSLQQRLRKLETDLKCKNTVFRQTHVRKDLAQTTPV